MSAEVPDVVDAWRMVAGGREFAGRLPLSGFARLRASLVGAEGEVGVGLSFGRDAPHPPHLELRISADLPLECQRSLRRFVLPVRLVQRLGLIRDEADEAALPAGYEALLVPGDGAIRLPDLVEDELILALPIVPVAPGSMAVECEWSSEQQRPVDVSPFAALAVLKRQN